MDTERSMYTLCVDNGIDTITDNGAVGEVATDAVLPSEVSYVSMIASMEDFLANHASVSRLGLKVQCVRPGYHIIIQKMRSNRWADLYESGTCLFTRSSLLRIIKEILPQEDTLHQYFNGYSLATGRKAL